MIRHDGSSTAPVFRLFTFTSERLEKDEEGVKVQTLPDGNAALKTSRPLVGKGTGTAAALCIRNIGTCVAPPPLYHGRVLTTVQEESKP